MTRDRLIEWYAKRDKLKSRDLLNNNAGIYKTALMIK